MSEIKPALTPEGWAAALADEDGPPPGEHEYRLAALYLHGQPFGFTWDDVDALRQVNYPWSNDLAERIAALLPPGEP